MAKSTLVLVEKTETCWEREGRTPIVPAERDRHLSTAEGVQVKRLASSFVCFFFFVLDVLKNFFGSKKELTTIVCILVLIH